MLIVNDGVTRNGRIEVDIYTRLEHGPMRDVSGIILHQTSSRTAFTTKLGYAFTSDGNGAHFLIDPKGDIYQTARITQVCYHVGRIKAYCKQVHMCTPRDEEVLAGIAKKYANNDAERYRQVDAWERAKPAALRYPTNYDSIGIEVVGAPQGGVYVSPTNAQNASARWLVSELLITLKLDRKRIFAHGLIDPRKFESEGGMIAH